MFFVCMVALYVSHVNVSVMGNSYLIFECNPFGCILWNWTKDPQRDFTVYLSHCRAHLVWGIFLLVVLGEKALRDSLSKFGYTETG